MCIRDSGKHVYHAEAVTRMEAFVQTAHDPDKSVDMLISSKRNCNIPLLEGYYPVPAFIQRERIILRYDIDRYIRLGMLRDTAYDRGLANRSGSGPVSEGAGVAPRLLLGSWSHGCCMPTNRA